MAFQRMTQDLTESIDDIFFDISQHIAQDLMLCDTDVQYMVLCQDFGQLKYKNFQFLV